MTKGNYHSLLELKLAQSVVVISQRVRVVKIVGLGTAMLSDKQIDAALAFKREYGRLMDKDPTIKKLFTEPEKAAIRKQFDPCGVTTFSNITAANETWEEHMTILDSQGHEVKTMPEWHKDISPTSLIQWSGHWFEFVGIDPDHDPDVVIIKYKEPTGKTKKRHAKS